MKTNDILLSLLSEIDDCQIELDELNECGTLEERLECAMRLENLKREHMCKALMETGG